MVDQVQPNLGLSETEAAGLDALLAYRERAEWEESLGAASPEGTALAAGPSPRAQALAARVSAKAFKLIVDYETGGRAFYEQHYKSRAVWPKAASGITIGFGYDLGYVRRDEFERDWAALLSGLTQAQRAAFAACIGRHGGPDTAAMPGLLAAVSDIVVPWELAEAVFKAKTLPKFALFTDQALPNCAALGGDCFGALVSLTFNRGASYGKAQDPADSNDRYREMRAIKADMAAGRFSDIPNQMRAMIRIWVGGPIETGMRRRRTDEAALFQQGLAAEPPGPMAVVAAPEFATEAAPVAFEAAVLAPDADSTTAPGDEEAWIQVGEDEVAGAAIAGVVTESASVGAVWADDAVQPDYSHLGPDLPKGVSFAFTADDLALLARLNDFDVGVLGDATPVLFGLRGAGIVKDHTNPNGIVLVDQRPDHIVPRCTIGVWDRKASRISVFPGSTVPNQQAVAAYKARRASGNLLSTGLYDYVCGPHVTSHTTPGCFLLRKPDMSKRVVVIRRSTDDLAYERTDVVERSAPGDNIHPAFFSLPVGFSSFGCQVVVGTFKDGQHRGPWSDFRKAATLADADGTPGKRFVYMLLTGAEARMASRLRQDGLAGDSIAQRKLRRLRFGSGGEAVTRLQQRLGLPSPDGTLGPFSTESLHRFQAGLGAASGSDGVYTPGLDAALGWKIFGSVGV